MAINNNDAKLVKSQRLSDEEDGGGRVTGREVIDCNVNNLFPDVSRIDRESWGQVFHCANIFTYH